MANSCLPNWLLSTQQTKLVVEYIRESFTLKNYDLIVIGSGPGGQKAAIQAAKLGKRVAIIEKEKTVGGAQVNTGTIPSKTLREVSMYLTGYTKRNFYGEAYRVKQHITIADLVKYSEKVKDNELNVIRNAFERNDIDLVWGHAHFIDDKTIEVVKENVTETLVAEKFVIAVGTQPARPDHIDFGSEHIYCSDSILEMKKLPKSMIIVGGGVIGSEYACILSTLGIKITLIEGRNQLLGFLDPEIAEAFQYHLRKTEVTLRLGEKVEEINVIEEGEPSVVEAILESGKKIKANALLYSVGRRGVCGKLKLENVGVEYSDREKLTVNEYYQTSKDHIYAVGDVIGFPALASTSMEQGRLAACHAFGEPTNSIPELFPYGIYTVPEISMVGKTEKQLTEEGIPYETGKAQYEEIARGQIIGDDIGMLKLIIHQETLQILGIHAIGTGATELVHIGQAVMAFNGTVDYFINNVFNFPTLAEAYKIAALNGKNKIMMV